MQSVSKNISIRAKVFFCITVLMLLPIILITVITYRFSETNLTEQLQRQDALAIGHLEVMLNLFFDSIEQHGTIVANDERTVELLKSVQNQTSNLSSTDLLAQVNDIKDFYEDTVPAVVGFSLWNNSQKLVAEDDYINGQLDVFFADIFNVGLSQTNPEWIDYFRLYSTNSQDPPRVNAVAIPINSEGVFLGYVVLYVELLYLNNFINSFTQDTYILDTNAKILAHSSFTQQTDTAFTPNFYSVSDIAYSLLTKNNSEIVNRGDEPFIITTRVFERARLSLVMTSPFSEVGDETLGRMSAIVLLCVASIVLGIIVALVTSQFITRPIINLKNAMLNATKNHNTRYITTTTDEIASLGVAFNELLDNTQKLMVDGEQQQEDKRRLQMRLLNEQLKPHFLYNALEMSVSLIDEKMYDMAKKSILSLSRFYRISLSDGNDVVSIEKEYEMINNYLTIQQMRYIEFFDFSISFHPNIFEYSIPKLTLQPIVENAIYHGIKVCEKRNMLCVVGYLQDSRIYFEIFDDGVGMSGQTIENIYRDIDGKEDTESFGMSNVMRRLNLFFNNDATIEIASEEGKYSNITISFPID